MSHPRFILTALCLVGVTALFTYATTRTMTTEDVLERAQGDVRAYLEGKDLIFVPTGDGKEIDDATWRGKESVYLEGRDLLAQISMAGGMYYWWNEAIPFWGAGLLLLATGCLVPFVSRRGSAP